MFISRKTLHEDVKINQLKFHNVHKKQEALFLEYVQLYYLQADILMS